MPPVHHWPNALNLAHLLGHRQNLHHQGLYGAEADRQTISQMLAVTLVIWQKLRALEIPSGSVLACCACQMCHATARVVSATSQQRDNPALL